WSPDGQQIAFDARVTGSSDIYVVSADGGSPRQLTTEPSADITPAWSKDGRWIFFASDRDGDWQIWGVPAAGGKAVQVTRNGGRTPLAAMGGFLYYARNGGIFNDAKNEPGVWKVSLEGGEETRVFDRGVAGQLLVTREGIYFVNDATEAQEISF